VSTDQSTHRISELGRGDSASQLFPLVYEELRSLAAGYFRAERVGHTLEPTALVHEAYLRLVQQTDGNWKNRAHFFAVAARAMRNVLVNHALARKAQKRGGGQPTILIDTDLVPARGREVDPVELDDALKRLAALDPRKADVVEMRFFGGLTVEEVAHAMGVSVSTVEADWRMAKAWLSKALSS
jgi:RNA polymerase sigma factor (TIGR02999 family)